MKFKETKSQERLINLMLQAGVEWPKRASHAVFLPNGSNPSGVIFSTGKPKYVPSVQGFSVDGGVFLHSDSFLADWSVPNWHQATITREMWEVRDGWITWHGGECPVDGDVVVQVKIRDGEPKWGGVETAESWYWYVNEADEVDEDIIAYRIHKPAEQTADDELCESIEAGSKCTSKLHVDVVEVSVISDIEKKTLEADKHKEEFERCQGELSEMRKALDDMLAVVGLKAVEV